MSFLLVSQLVGCVNESNHETMNDFHKLKFGRHTSWLKEKLRNCPNKSNGRQEICVTKFFPFETSDRFHPRFQKEFGQAVNCYHEKVKRRP